MVPHLIFTFVFCICQNQVFSHDVFISTLLDGDNAQNTSVTSNVTDEGLDLSQRISDSIFQGPDLASEEEELLQGR